MNVADMRFMPPGYITSRFGEIEFTDWIDESMSWKRTCSIGDWSWIWERRFKGPDAMRLLRDTVINGFKKFDILQSKHATHVNNDGKIIAEGILTRVGEEGIVLVGGGSFWVDYVRRQGNYDVVSEHEDWYNFQVAGPNTLALLEEVSGTDLRDVKFMHSGELEIAGTKLLALRQGMSFGPGFELQGPTAHAKEVYAEILKVGEKYGLRRLGGRASNVGHLEACFPTAGLDYLPGVFGVAMKDYREEYFKSLGGFAKFSVNGSFEAKDVSDYYRSPIELGWGKNIRFDHDFIGRAALEKEAAEPSRVMRTLVWDPKDVVDVYASYFQKAETPFQFMEIPREQRATMTADKVLIGDREVGVATSRGYSYYFREMLSLVCIEPEAAEPGTEVVVVWGNPGEPQKEIRATVAPAPYQDNRRDDLHKY